MVSQLGSAHKIKDQQNGDHQVKEIYSEDATIEINNIVKHYNFRIWKLGIFTLQWNYSKSKYVKQTSA
jgi:hypothetical protein